MHSQFFTKRNFGDMIAYFDTTSCAEFHWLPLHEIIIKYYLKISGDDEDECQR